MKLRTDFVTNSSSSSFVCEICGRSESGWDMCISEVGMMECVNGHVFCCDEALVPTSKSDIVKVILENEWNKHRWDNSSNTVKTFSEEELLMYDDETLFDEFVCSADGSYEIPECMCPICQFIEYSEYDLSEYLLKKYGVSRDEAFAEVKKMNKRRRKLYENEYITYVCKQFDLNPTEIVASWKERFGTYEEFKKWLRQ